MEMGLKGKAALVTGGTTGLGAAITRLLAEEGCCVAANYIGDSTEAQAFADSVMKGTGSDCVAVFGDISSVLDAGRMVDETVRRFGGIDILINNAACLLKNDFQSITPAEWQRMIDVNLTGTFMVTQNAVRFFLERGIRGKVISVVSQSAFRGTKSGHAHYTASKAGIVGMTVSLAQELSKDGIRVNCVAPGIIDTPMVLDKIRENVGRYSETIPLGRPARPVEAAYAVLFLASKMGNYLTGTTIDVSGGMLMR